MEDDIEYSDLQKKFPIVLWISIIVAIVLIFSAVSYVWVFPIFFGNSNLQFSKTSDTKLPARDVIMGVVDSPITLVEYGDYQCQVCVRFFDEAEEQLRNKYVKTGKMRIVYRNFAHLGPESFLAAEAAECAKDQKKFWPYHDLLFKVEIQDGLENNGNLDRDLFLDLAGRLDMDIESFSECLSDKRHSDYINREISNARYLGVSATPIFFINEKKIEGFSSYKQMEFIIENALNSI